MKISIINSYKLYNRKSYFYNLISISFKLFNYDILTMEFSWHFILTFTTLTFFNILLALQCLWKIFSWLFIVKNKYLLKQTFFSLKKGGHQKKELQRVLNFFLVRAKGLEPPWITPLDPKSSASANFATRAHWWTLQDSNLRPPGYEPDALTNWAKGPTTT